MGRPRCAKVKTKNFVCLQLKTSRHQLTHYVNYWRQLMHYINRLNFWPLPRSVWCCRQSLDFSTFYTQRTPHTSSIHTPTAGRLAHILLDAFSALPEYALSLLLLSLVSPQHAAGKRRASRNFASRNFSQRLEMKMCPQQGRGGKGYPPSLPPIVKARRKKSPNVPPWSSSSRSIFAAVGREGVGRFSDCWFLIWFARAFSSQGNEKLKEIKTADTIFHCSLCVYGGHCVRSC